MPFPPPLPAAAAQPSPPRPYAEAPAALSRAQLGMTLEAWRATAAAQGAVCDDVRGASRICRVAAAPLGGAYRARDLTYAFQNGRLARIAFDASIDALPYAAAVVKSQFGAPATTRRDRIQTQDGPLEHLAYTWSGQGASARLSDPTPRSDRLQVVFSLNGA